MYIVMHTMPAANKWSLMKKQPGSLLLNVGEQEETVTSSLTLPCVHMGIFVREFFEDGLKSPYAEKFYDHILSVIDDCVCVGVCV